MAKSTIKERLNTERLLLRTPMLDDLDAYYSWGSSAEMTRYMTWGPNDREQTEEFLAGVKPGSEFAVVLKETDEVIGSCGIRTDERNFIGTVGWILHKNHWRCGYGKEVARELVRYGFEDLKLGRIQATCAVVNHGSYRVMENIGMQREALRRKAFYVRMDDEWIDELQYAILAEDYMSK